MTRGRFLSISGSPTTNKGNTVDPNATLAEIRDLVKRTLDGVDEAYAMDLAESVENLDKWITNGGFLPGEWEEV